MFSDKDKQRILSYFEHKNKPAPAASEIDSLKTDLMEFRGEFEHIDQRNNLLEDENAALKKENERLEREAINAFQMFTNADARLSAQINENVAAKARIAELEKQRDNLQQLLATTAEERDNLECQLLERGERDE